MSIRNVSNLSAFVFLVQLVLFDVPCTAAGQKAFNAAEHAPPESCVAVVISLLHGETKKKQQKNKTEKKKNKGKKILSLWNCPQL